MSLLSENLFFRQALNKIASYRYLFLLLGIVILAVLFRCLHLFNANYFVLSPDSYFFHWLAGRIVLGAGPPADAPAGALYTLHTGLTYPIVYLAKALSYGLGLSSADAINFAAKFIPLSLGVVSLIVIYIAGSKIHGPKEGLFSALSWALMLFAVMIGGAGYIDRDGLSVLLIMIGALVFYFSQYFHIRIGKWDLGWLAGGLAVLIIEGLLYLEWTYPGPVLLLAIIAAYVLIRLVVEYLNYVNLKPNAWHALKLALNKVNWRTSLAILGVNILFFLLNPNTDVWGRFMAETISSGGESGVAEMAGIGLYDILLFQLFLIPMVLGIYLACKKRSNGAVFFSSWFLGLFALSLFSRRVLIYALPAVCLLSGIGLAFLWEWRRCGKSQSWKNTGVYILLFLLVLISFAFVSTELSTPVMAVNEDWQNALSYLKEKTPLDSVVMTSWSWGYWILDLAQRRPVVDNGYYYYNDQKLLDVGLAYVTSDSLESVHIMEKYGANYLVFSDLDLNSEKSIIKWANMSDKYDMFPEDSLVIRALDEGFEPENGLEVVYRNPGVVILGLSQTVQNKGE